jgi:hypothetical protein
VLKAFKSLSTFLAGSLVGLLAFAFWNLQPDRVEKAMPDPDLESSLDSLADAIRDAGDFVRGHPWFGSDEEQAEAYRHIVRSLVNKLEGRALSDPDFPVFQAINHFSKAGMDNSDQRYRMALFNGGGIYRVWGTRGTSRRLDFSVYGVHPLSDSVDTLSTDELELAPDGTFELIVGGAETAGNWLRSEAGEQRLLVRQIHSDWSRESPGEIHMDRIDAARPPYPLFTQAIMAERLADATNAFAEEVRLWPEFSRTRLAGLAPANQLFPPRDTGGQGGLAGRLMVGGHYALEDDEALILTNWPTDAAYQGVQLGHHWWESLDYANRQTSLTADQARLSSDGAYHYVVSERDPKLPNWLDTEGFSRGVILMRYDGLSTPQLPAEQHPTAAVVKFSALREHLPQDEPVVTEAERARSIAARRAHVQEREDF